MGKKKSEDVTIDDFSQELQGKTLKVYWCVLKKPGGIRLRDIQRITNLSSPSLVSYHLEKLMKMDLIEADVHGIFFPKRMIKVGVLKLFIGQGRFFVPRYLFYTIFYICMLFGVLVSFPFIFGPLYFLCVSILLFGITTSIIETIKAWKMEI